MRTYFIHDGKDQRGPFTLEELRSVGLQPGYSVWTEGMANWTSASELAELQGFFLATPPDFPAPPEFVEPDSGTPVNRQLFLYIAIGLVVVSLGAWALFRQGDKEPGRDSVAASTDTATTVGSTVAPIDSATTITISSDPVPAVTDTTTTITHDIVTSVPIVTDTTAAADYAAQYYTTDLRAELIAKEQERPLDFLKMDCELTENLVGENVFKGSITNSATAAPFKDIVVHVIYYSGTDTELARDHFTIYKYIAAGTTANFKIKRPGTSSNVKKFRIGIVNALPAE